jgi:arabinosaccharide transport system permease protein
MARVRATGFLRYSLMFLAGLLFLFPIFALVMSSFRPGRDLIRYGITFQSLVPDTFDLKNYQYLWEGKDGIYLLWYKNSLILTALQTGLSLFLSSLVGYGLGVYRFWGRGFIFLLVLVVMLIPIQILILPLYSMMIDWGTMDTYWGVFLPFVVSPFAIFFFRQYAEGIPKDYLDAGRIDGLGEFSIYFRITAPLMAPAFGAMAILMAQQSWNSFLWPLIVMRSNEMLTLPIGLNTLLTPYGNNYNMLIAGAAMASLPVIVVFFLFQKYFMSGLTTGGIKG